MNSQRKCSTPQAVFAYDAHSGNDPENLSKKGGDFILL
jgi:hypothetical protein